MLETIRQRGGQRTGAGRPKKSLLKRVQIGTWYCQLRAVSQLNDCQLDCLIAVPKGKPPCDTAERPHICERIRVYQRDPDHSRYCDEPHYAPRKSAKDRVFNIVTRCDSHWPGLRGVYDHELWKLMGKKRPDEAFIAKTIASKLGPWGMRRMSFITTAAVVEPARRRQTNALFLTKVVQHANLDDLALIAALLIEAARYHAWALVDELRTTFVDAAKRFSESGVLQFVPSLPEWFLEAIDQFLWEFAPGRGNVSEVNHLSMIVPDTEESRRFEAEHGLNGHRTVGQGVADGERRQTMKKPELPKQRRRVRQRGGAKK